MYGNVLDLDCLLYKQPYIIKSMKPYNDTIFQEPKAAQAAAFMLYKANGRLEVLKLMKLMYLAERESFSRFGECLTGDALVSMPHGPVLSMTLDFINGGQESVPNGWTTWVSDRENKMLALRDPSMIRTPEQDLLALSETDLEVLESVWENYGHYSAWDLRNMTHNGLCPEWEDPHGSSRPIPIKKLLSVLGYDDEQAVAIVERLEEQAYINRAFG